MENQENKQQDNSKVEKQYQDGLSKLMTLLKDDKSVFGNKISNTDVDGLIEKMIKEKKEKASADFCEKASQLLEAKVQFDRDCAQKKKEFESAILSKKKEFTTQMNNLFQMIQNINELHKSYRESLGNVVTTEEVAPTTTEETSTEA